MLKRLGMWSPAVLVLLLVGCAHSTVVGNSASPPATNLPLAELTVGGVQLGSSIADVKRAFGEPAAVRAYPQQAEKFLEYPTRGLSIGVNTSDGLVRDLSVSAPSDVKTARGIGLGATAENVRKAYGSPRDTSWTYPIRDVSRDSAVLAFTFSGGHVVTIVATYDP